MIVASDVQSWHSYCFYISVRYYLAKLINAPIMKAPTIILMIVCFSLQSFAKEELTIEQYIDTYAALAVSEMKSSNIPASVTLAQGILESHFGNSYLAREANNHFGIKCHSSWTGKKVYRDDDKKNECFRKYGHPVQSFRDHSTFLKAPRYAFLFDLDKSDYVSWCYGLKEAGYATDKKYPTRLIDLIERYNLDQYDSHNEMVASRSTEDAYASAGAIDEATISSRSTSVNNSLGASSTKASRGVSVGAGKNANSKSRNTTKARSSRKSRSRIQRWLGRGKSEPTVIRPEPGMKTKVMQSETFYFNNIKTVVVTEECTPMQIARTYSISVNRLCDYNEFDANTIIPAQSKVFLQPKRNMGPVTDETIRVQEGQTMENISQYYGIKLKALYKRNKLRVGTQPAIGELIYLRGKNPRVPKTVIRESLAVTNNRFIQTPGKRKNNRESEITHPTNYKIPEPMAESSNSHAKTTSGETSTTIETEPRVPTETSRKVIRETGTSSSYSNGSNRPSSSTHTSPTVRNSTSSNTRKPDGVIVGSLDDEPSIINGKVVKTRTTEPRRIVTGSLDEPRITSKIEVVEDSGSRVHTRSRIVVVDDDETMDNNRVKQYKVKSGDTLWGLSKRFNVSVDRIKAASNIKSNSLAIGQTLRIPMN